MHACRQTGTTNLGMRASRATVLAVCDSTAALPRLVPLACAVSLDNRGHHFADVAEELQQDDSLARHLGEAAAKLVEGSLTPGLVQARGPEKEEKCGSKAAMDAPQAASSGGHCLERYHAAMRHSALGLDPLPHCLIACRPTGSCCCGGTASCRTIAPRCTLMQSHLSKASCCPRRVVREGCRAIAAALGRHTPHRWAISCPTPCPP